ncbi:MAG: peptide deformylase [Nitrospinota bacterium]
MADLFINQKTIFKVAQLGHPILRKTAEPVTPEELTDPRTANFIDSLIATMREYSGAGLAAPQVHVSKQLLAIESQANPRYPDGEDIPLTILINPKITSFSETMEEGWEGCLSLKDLWGRVKRSDAITVEALTREGKETTINAQGFFAVVLQHEIDHLHGKLFVDRMDDMSTLCFTAEYNRYQSP